MDRLQALDQALVAFLCERTGLSGVEVRQVFAAWDEFCDHHLTEIAELFDD